MNIKDLELKRKSLKVSQKTVAEWIGLEKSSYSKKKSGVVPMSIDEYNLIINKLNEIEIKSKEVVHTYPLRKYVDNSKVDAVCSIICSVYESKNNQVISAFERGMEGIKSMLYKEHQAGEILNKLNILIMDNNEFHSRLDKNDERVLSIEKKVNELLELESPAENSVDKRKKGEAAASLSTFGDAWYAEE